MNRDIINQIKLFVFINDWKKQYKLVLCELMLRFIKHAKSIRNCNPNFLNKKKSTVHLNQTIRLYQSKWNTIEDEDRHLIRYPRPENNGILQRNSNSWNFDSVIFNAYNLSLMSIMTASEEAFFFKNGYRFENECPIIKDDALLYQLHDVFFRKIFLKRYSKHLISCENCINSSFP